MIVCLAFLLAFSAGCKSSTGTKHTEEIKVWDYFTGKQQDLYHELVEQYNRSQDRYKVVTEYIPFNEVKSSCLSVQPAMPCLTPYSLTMSTMLHSPLWACSKI